MKKNQRFICIILLFIIVLSPIKQVQAANNSLKQVKIKDDTYILENTKQFDKLKSPKIAVALGGGGGRALVHIGVLKALKEEGIPIDMLVGTSMGAVVGTMYGSGVPTKTIEKVATKAAFYNLFETNFLASQQLLKTEKMNNFLEKLAPVDRLEKFPTPTAFLSYDLNSGAKYVHTSGKISNKIQSAYAIPYYFPIKKQGDFTFIDPGIMELTPAKTAKVLGANIVISSTAIAKLPYDNYNTATRSVMRLMQLLQQKNSRPLTEKYSDIIIDNPVAKYSFMDFSLADKLISIGYRETKKKMPQIKELMRKHNISIEKSKQRKMNITPLLTDLKYDRINIDSTGFTPLLYFGKDHSSFKQQLFQDDLFKIQYGFEWRQGLIETTVLNNQHSEDNLEAQLRVKKLTPTTDLISQIKSNHNDWALSLKHYAPHYTFSLGRRSIDDKQFNLIGNQYNFKKNNWELKGETSLLITPQFDSYKVLTSQQGLFKLSSIWSAKPKLVYNNTDLLNSPIIYRGREPKDKVESQAAIDWIYTHEFLPTIKLMHAIQLTNIQYYLFTDYQSSYDSSHAVGIGAKANLKLLGLKPLDFGIYIADDSQKGNQIGFEVDLTF
ncbi:patatin-like phospholipase family protein [Sporohalobacter salinus]|uniref:patatin-like phospholipase family protein n=1 Tax=Sporohalobacter salinus TaxID=1494606 RepID=UPI00195F6C98|nr:patatin-like phospholipase family protein [Sporohalobacter salinus]MBM7623183.1 NTE family protein [Sporohalobacter salinus]